MVRRTGGGQRTWVREPIAQPVRPPISQSSILNPQSSYCRVPVSCRQGSAGGITYDGTAQRKACRDSRDRWVRADRDDESARGVGAGWCEVRAGLAENREGAGVSASRKGRGVRGRSGVVEIVCGLIIPLTAGG